MASWVNQYFIVLGCLFASGHPFEFGGSHQDIFLQFLHFPKSGGTYFLCFAEQQMDMLLPPQNHGNLICNDLYKKWCPPGSTNNNWVPFPFWDTSAQIHFYSNQLQPSNFLCNEIGFDDGFVPPGTVVAGSKRLEYMTIFRDPVDRFMSYFMYGAWNMVYLSRHGFGTMRKVTLRYSRATSTSSFRRARSHFLYLALSGSVAFSISGSMVAGPSACGQPPDSHVVPQYFGQPGMHCGRDALDLAKRRLDSFHVVLVLDWVHLSGPLLCQKLGWCYADALHELSFPASNCGARETLAAAGAGEWVLEELVGRMALDYELLDHAQHIARAQLLAAGVELPQSLDHLGLPDKTVCKPAGEKTRVRGKSCPVRPR